MRRLQQGFGMIAAIVVLVILASLAAAMATFGISQQLTSAQDVLSTKAWQAAMAGNEWGLYMALNAGTGWTGGTKCAPSSAIGVPGAQQAKNIDLSADLGFSVSVMCSATMFNEGEDPATPAAPKVTTLYVITSKAANGTSVTSPGYVERTRVVLAEQ